MLRAISLFQVVTLMTVLQCRQQSIYSSAFGVQPLLTVPSSISTHPLYAKARKKSSDKTNDSRQKKPRSPSKVIDYDGPTPEERMDEPISVDPDSIAELRDITNDADLPRPIPHQSWRRGDTAGCEAPIHAEWRRDAEECIYKAAKIVGATVLDVTWYLTAVVVTLDNQHFTIGSDEENERVPDLLKSSGPVIDIIERRRADYKDPNEPNVPDVDAGDEIVWQRETPEEAEANRIKNNMRFARKDEFDDPMEQHIPVEAAEPEVGLYANSETRQDRMLFRANEELERYEAQEKPLNIDTLTLDSAVLSTIANAILTSLEQHEDEWQVLSRHEVILTSPGASDVLDTQRQFDAYRGFDVIVETQDPFESNRTLKGKLVDRNSMDLIINKKGRLVTIPLNFVKCVRLPPAKREKGVPRDAPF